MITEKTILDNVECRACGPIREHDILFNCSHCKLSLCEEHIRNHQCVNPRYGQNLPLTPINRTYAFNFSQLRDFYRAQQRREPTKEEYELYLRANPRVLTSGKESIDLLAGVLLIAFVFGFRPILAGTSSWQYVLMLTIIISPAFILHELGHKYMAIYYGKYARFTLIRQMAYLTLLFGFIGFGIAGPGATMILGSSNKEESGKFAAAGPIINFALAALAYLLTNILPPIYFNSIDKDLHSVLMLAMFINAFLGLFNLLPFGILDGKKIVDWNSLVWVILVLLNLLALFVALPHI